MIFVIETKWFLNQIFSDLWTWKYSHYQVEIDDKGLLMDKPNSILYILNNVSKYAVPFLFIYLFL